MNEPDNKTQISQTELMKRIRQSFAALEAAIQQFNSDEPSPTRSSDWAIKDHLTHVAIWEEATAELLQGLPWRKQFTVMGIEDAFAREWSEIDKINELILHSYGRFSAAEAKRLFYNAHHRLLQALEPLSDEDLQQHYTVHSPDSKQIGRQEPIWQIIIWTTCDHFDEHAGFIRNLTLPVESFDN
jgi:hypothetical protein